MKDLSFRVTVQVTDATTVQAAQGYLVKSIARGAQLFELEPSDPEQPDPIRANSFFPVIATFTMDGAEPARKSGKLLDVVRAAASELNDLNAFMACDEFPKLDRAMKDLFYEEQRTRSSLVQILGKRLELKREQFSHAPQ